ncbi:MAG: DUF1080 domain-containing protein [Sedimentisphaerales bacterium]|nr:DUF1080 domain-containing protein [Sedimentisphaerales bacterium]
MKRTILILVGLGVICTIGIPVDGYQDTPLKPNGYHVHDEFEPRPTVITPGKTDDMPPSDAIVLFDGSNMDQWEHINPKRKADWQVADGLLASVDKAGYIQTKQKFGSMQFHIEWSTPSEVKGSSQGRGNSGVFLMGTYEIQVLDSYNNDTYPDGQASAVYGQKKPDVNASRGPGQWQSYDIIFHRPIFKAEGSNEVVKPGTVTVLHNGVLVQDHWVIEGVTNHKQLAKYRYHPDAMPIQLQDHGNPVHFRNIWVRPLPD